MSLKNQPSWCELLLLVRQPLVSSSGFSFALAGILGVISSVQRPAIAWCQMLLTRLCKPMQIIFYPRYTCMLVNAASTSTHYRLIASHFTTTSYALNKGAFKYLVEMAITLPEELQVTVVPCACVI
jgi:hypothetical protein